MVFIIFVVIAMIAIIATAVTIILKKDVKHAQEFLFIHLIFYNKCDKII